MGLSPFSEIYASLCTNPLYLGRCSVPASLEEHWPKPLTSSQVFACSLQASSGGTRRTARSLRLIAALSLVYPNKYAIS